MANIKLKAAFINLTGQRKLSTGNRNKLLAFGIYFFFDGSDGARDLSGDRLRYSKQFSRMNLNFVCPLGFVEEHRSLINIRSNYAPCFKHSTSHPGFW